MCTENHMEHQELINELHLAFREQAKTEELVKWDGLMTAIARKHFSEEQAQAFFEAQATLLTVFANDLIAFIIDFFTEEFEEK